MEIETLNVSGMTCGGCTRKVMQALKSVAGVDTVDVSLADGNAMVRYDERKTSMGELRWAVMAAGFRIGGLQAEAGHQAEGDRLS
jgi:copper chaperone CopZ